MCHGKLDQNVVWQEEDHLLQTNNIIHMQNKTLKGLKIKHGQKIWHALI